MSELPEGWKLVKVRDAGRVQLGRQRSPEFHNGASMRPYLRVANVHEDELRLDDVMEMHFDAEDIARFELRPGDILLNEGQSRELVGRPAMYRGELPGACFTNSLIRFQASDGVEPRFAFQLFRHWMRQGDFQDNAQVTTNIAHLGAGRFAEMDFPLPPLNEQRRIVAKLEDLLARSRRARAALDAIPPLLEKLRQSVLAAAFRGDLTADWREKNPDVEPAEELLVRIRAERQRKWEEAELAKMTAKGKAPTDDRWKERYVEPEPLDASELPELPLGWCWSSLSTLADVQLGQQRAPIHTEAEVSLPYMRAANITWDGLDLSDVKRMGFPDAARYRLHIGDILLSEASGSASEVGKPAVWRGEIADCCYQKTLIRLRSMGGKVAGEWLFHACLHDARTGKFAAVAPGVGILHLTAERMLTWPIPVAPLAEQEVIVRRLGDALAHLRQLEHGGRTLGETCRRFDRATLAKAFRGELVSQDPNDEPAEGMLARLREASDTNGQTTAPIRTRKVASS